MQISKEQQEEIRKPSWGSMQRSREKQQNGKDQRSLQANQNYQRNICAKMGTINDINSMNLTETEDIKKKKQQEYKEILQERS